MLLYWWLKKREREKPRALTVKFKPVQNQDTNQFSSVMQFMTNHYMNPLISVSFVCDQLGISEATLNSEINKASSLTFKLLLNQLRIEEAKRLLLHTDSKISLIAQIVGYENVTHFNRTFKKETQQSPSAYRTTAQPQ